MAIIPAVVSEDYVKFLPMITGNILHPASSTNTGTLLRNPSIKWFKMAEGGWILNNQGFRVRRVAVPNLRMLSTVVMPGPQYETGLQYQNPDPYGGTDIYVQALDAEVDFTRNPVDPNDPPRYNIPGGGKGSRYVSLYQDLASTDFQWLTPATLQVTCLLDFDEENDDGGGFNPEFCELGLYTDHPLQSGSKLLVAYCTFPKELKDENRQLENVVKIVFG